jgi:hypothetical protein
MKESLQYSNTIVLFKLPSMYAFFCQFLIGPAVQSHVICQGATIPRCLEYFQDSPCLYAHLTYLWVNLTFLKYMRNKSLSPSFQSHLNLLRDIESFIDPLSYRL